MARLGFILTSAFCLTAVATAAQQAPVATNDSGYAGVCPGSGNQPAVAVPAGQSPARITWPGFQMLPNQSSRIFVQASVPFQFSTESRGRTFVVSLGDVKIAGENNARPLETRFFNTPVLRASVKRVKKQTTLVLELRADVTPRVHSETGANGYFFLYLDFPAGQYADAPAPTAAAAVTTVPKTSAEAAASGGDPMTGSSIGARANGSVRTSVSSEQQRTLDNERPPAVRASGSLSLTGGN